MKLTGIVIATTLVFAGGVASAGSAGDTTDAVVTIRTAVSAQANIFGAGYETPPAPSGGGKGVLPRLVKLPAGESRVVTFPGATGRVSCCWGQPDSWNETAGNGAGPTNIRSWRGISGIVHRGNAMFLVGVFLTSTRPSLPAPPRLDFTGREFDLLEPRIGQTFLIGDGKFAGDYSEPRQYVVPQGATRLFLGFADAYLTQGTPGWYGNNRGSLRATVLVSAT